MPARPKAPEPQPVPMLLPSCPPGVVWARHPDVDGVHQVAASAIGTPICPDWTPVEAPAPTTVPTED